MHKLLVSTILATSLVAGGALAQAQTQTQQQNRPAAQNQQVQPGAATTATRNRGAMQQQTPIAMNKLSANKLIGADVRTYVGADARTSMARPPAGAAGTTATGAVGTGTGVAGSGTTAPATGPAATTGGARTGTVAGAATSVNDNVEYDTEYLGEVYDIILGKNGVEQLVIETGGILGIGERYRAVPFADAQLVRQGDDVVVLLRMSQAQLRAQPSFEYRDGWWD